MESGCLNAPLIHIPIKRIGNRLQCIRRTFRLKFQTSRTGFRLHNQRFRGSPGIDDTSLRLALRFIHRTLSLSLRPNDRRPLSTFRSHLHFHRSHDLVIGDDIPYLDPRDLDSPRIGSYIQILEKDGVDLLPRGERHIQRQLPNLRSQLRKHKVLYRQLQIDNGVDRFLRIKDAPVYHGVGGQRGVVGGDALLGGYVENLFSCAQRGSDVIYHRYLEVYARFDYLGESTQSFND
mmetsp:Transcript_16125/g.19099  ORF Transcript_16125/g.19099 Transcript_16125/m.19099 type:complete len:234 (-) Transcript_16125:297-998(-)